MTHVDGLDPLLQKTTLMRTSCSTKIRVIITLVSLMSGLSVYFCVFVCLHVCICICICMSECGSAVFKIFFLSTGQQKPHDRRAFLSSSSWSSQHSLSAVKTIRSYLTRLKTTRFRNLQLPRLDRQTSTIWSVNKNI